VAGDWRNDGGTTQRRDLVLFCFIPLLHKRLGPTRTEGKMMGLNVAKM
jgi:hypothetical protein